MCRITRLGGEGAFPLVLSRIGQFVLLSRLGGRRQGLAPRHGSLFAGTGSAGPDDLILA